ncbi:MAG: ABC transporter permease [Enterococcus sp.]|nr:ABC transporter permease [Enterococcus sp.]
MRTFLTAIAIFIGAFTLTLTNGVGAGISNYIDTQLDSIGGSNVIDIYKGTVEDIKASSGVVPYDPNKVDTPTGSFGPPGASAILEEDLETLQNIEGIESVRPVFFVAPDYIGNGDKKFEVSINTALPGDNIDFAAGGNISNADENQLILPKDYVEPLGYSSPEDAIDQTVQFAVTDATGNQATTEATIVGVQEPTLIDLGTNTSDSLRNTLYELQSNGTPENVPDSYASAQATFSSDASSEDIQAIKDRLTDAGYISATIEDQIGLFQTIINIVVTVLNGFAVIALIAAGFGIVNTLLMSVQERTREIGLMKAMGLSSSKIFSLFSVEAVLIGVIGSVAGVLSAIGVGSAISALASGALGDLGNVQIILFEPLSVLAVILVVMFIAFIAGTLPASRAAKQNPIDALRYE